MTTNGNSNGTNGSTDTQTALAKLHAEYVANGAAKPGKDDLAAVKKELLAAEKAYEDASKALEKAQAMKQAAAVKAIKLCGSKVRIDLGGGRVVAPSCRGESVFYRRIGETDTL